MSTTVEVGTQRVFRTSGALCFVLCYSMDVESHVLNVPCLNNAQLKYLDGKIFAYAGLGVIKIG